ncbi:hypothetical protein [Aliarcobacter butzleri]|uniref:hypothetical protein n=1 Tax=Aliarcobacter butzleri TaxID=28197 RepID=UPI0021B2E2E3|nr:hypothetical protein [Aliarcobacter butzleri]MCT7600299.1 hypothetical protein [Aliarcobacter butzleri]MCT7632970.1 hypothetical protein [Aliarcobacter butzleri]
MRIKNVIDWKKIEDLFIFTRQTWSKWKKENRPIVNLIEKYFDDKDIQEFLETGEIKKFENIKLITDNYIAKSQAFYLNSFTESQSSLSEPHVNDEFRDFYFNFLANFGKIDFPFNINVLGIQSLLTHYLFQYQTQKIKENLKIDKINKKLEDFKFEIDEAITSSKGEEKEELKKFKKNLQDETQKEEIVKNIFSKNERNFEGIMLHFFIFNSWNNDIFYFLELVKKDDFDYFINSKNDELLYQAIGYLVYSLSHNLNMEEKLQIISSIFHYFVFNKDLISSTNIKKQILKRLKNNESFSEIDKEISHKYITSPFPDNNTNKLVDSENKEIEIINFEDL